MKIYDDTKIYILAPANSFTGGPLSIHQLGSALKKSGCDVYMVYFNAQNSNESPVHKNFQKFHLPFLTGFESIENSPKNIVIFPETQTLEIDRFSNMQIVIFWLSVDFYINNMRSRLENIFKYGLALRLPTVTLNSIKFSEYDHLVQSEYARQFLTFNKIPSERIFYAGDYLDSNFMQLSSKIGLDSKENIVAFNPKKGFEFTQKIIESAQDLTFVPIYNMTSEEVQNLLARSKIYIDFGNHPGRDRIPREAVMSHCVVITNKRGSAGNAIDVPIDDDFKFEDTLENIPRIISKIKYVFENFKSEHDRQNSYREIILHERDKFFNDVNSIFERRNSNRVHTAIVGNLQDMEKMCEYLSKDKNVEIVFAVNDDLAGKKIFYSEEIKFEVISQADADFLYNEHRIDQFVVTPKFVCDETIHK